MRELAAGLVALLLLALPAAAETSWKLTGLRTIDGDTVAGRTTARPGVEVTVRLRDVDAPEIAKPRCAAERAVGLKAKARVEALLRRAGGRAELKRMRRDKYGRVAGEVVLPDRRDLATVLRSEGLVKPWPGGRGPKPDWCGAKR